MKTREIGPTKCDDNKTVVYNYDSTAIRPRYGHTTTCITTGLLHCGLNK